MSVLTRPERARELFFRATHTLGVTQRELGEILHVSTRTIIRHRGMPLMVESDWVRLAGAVHPKDRAIAAEIAQALGHTLVSLGIEAPPPPAKNVPTPRDLADSVVCAAAEAAGTTPQAMRPALLAAFTRAVAVGLSAEQTRDALAPERAPRSRK